MLRVATVRWALKLSSWKERALRVPLLFGPLCLIKAKQLAPAQQRLSEAASAFFALISPNCPIGFFCHQYQLKRTKMALLYTWWGHLCPLSGGKSRQTQPLISVSQFNVGAQHLRQTAHRGIKHFQMTVVTAATPRWDESWLTGTRKLWKWKMAA